MKKTYIFLLLACLSFSSQIFASEAYEQVAPPSKKSSQFALGHFGFSLAPDCSFGLTYGQVKGVGWYANLMTDFGFRFSGDMSADANGYVDGVLPFYTQKKKTSYFALTVGGIANIQVVNYSQLPEMYIFGGLGYGYRGVFYELTDGQWVSWDIPSSPKGGLHWEFGGMCEIEDIAISLGVSSVTNFQKSNFFEIKLGVGYFF
ncbi:MAG: hypothetical protein J6X43_07755 [Bacteroidales bacterium]|nr:hypothetical protein [Bacteroidales bacterium]